VPYDDDVDDRAVTALKAARSAPPAVETEEALARLESTLFAAPRARKALDRYTLVRRLGQGSSGVVYLALDPKLDRKVAIKLLHPHAVAVDGHTEGRARLLREAQAMARSPHPNVVAVYDVGTYDTEAGESGVFVVMEFAEGPTLQAWLGARSHAWRDVLDVFVAAGRGLAAAHEVGVTHRDFKPANVIVGDDGRVRVLDFGLARGLDREEENTLPGNASLDAKLALDAALTADGTVLGTPAFMAPEQHAGRAADPASDQYSFCVALWEGLFGARPFVGRSFEELEAAKRAGAPRVPAHRELPRGIGDVIARGLAVDPARRWPSMEALSAALVSAASQQPARPRVVLAIGGVALLAAGGWWLARGEAACSGADDRVAAVWNRERSTAIASAFEAAELPYGAASRQHVTERVEVFVEAWAQQHRDACEAGTSQAPDVLDLRMACLDAQLRETNALLSVFESADAGTVERAVETVARLPVPSRCADVDALRAEVAPPSDPMIAAAVEAERTELARVRALDDAGRIADGLAVARGVVDRATTLGYAPLLAEALYVRAALEDAHGRYDASMELLQRSHAIALESGHDRQAATSSTQLVFLHGYRRRDLESALQWAQAADAEQARAGADDRAALLLAMGSAYHTAERWADAEKHMREAIALIEERSGQDHPRLATAHNNLGETLRASGELDRAREEIEVARAIHERIHGPDHPGLGLALNNLASIDMQIGELERAEKMFRRVIDIRERALGSDHPEVATALANLGVTLRKLGRFDDARQAYERSLAVLRRYGPDDVRTAGVLLGLGRVEQEQGRLEAALHQFDRALALQEAGLPAEHLDIARSLQSRALLLVQLGDLAAARSSFQRAETIKARAPASVGWIADGRFAFAQALHERGEQAEAVALAERALEDAGPELRRDVAAWLAQRGGRYPEASGRSRPAGL
jgi:tetratricopeptide (TPR) repeat protein